MTDKDHATASMATMAIPNTTIGSSIFSAPCFSLNAKDPWRNLQGSIGWRCLLVDGLQKIFNILNGQFRLYRPARAASDVVSTKV